MKRSGKFYRRNEEEVMKMLGLRPTKNSGSGWIEKEDGQSENLICQLKSTDADSIKLQRLDFKKLEYNATVSKKIPVFVVQFIYGEDLYILCRPEDIMDVAKELESLAKDKKSANLNRDWEESLVDIEESKPKTNKKVIKSSANARKMFHDQVNKKFDKTKSAR